MLLDRLSWGTVTVHGSQSWGKLKNDSSGSSKFTSHADRAEEDRVLVVQAFGVPDNEVLARAWCAHLGLSATLADLSKTCMSCSIRQAYAACLTVVILIDGHSDDDLEPVDRRSFPVSF